MTETMRAVARAGAYVVACLLESLAMPWALMHAWNLAAPVALPGAAAAIEYHTALCLYFAHQVLLSGSLFGDSLRDLRSLLREALVPGGGEAADADADGAPARGPEASKRLLYGR